VVTAAPVVAPTPEASTPRWVVIASGVLAAIAVGVSAWVSLRGQDTVARPHPAAHADAGAPRR
jgi:hypothetical protein